MIWHLGVMRQAHDYLAVPPPLTFKMKLSPQNTCFTLGRFMRAQCKSITLEQFQNSYHQIAPYCKDSYEDVIQRIRNIHTVKRQGVLQGKEKKN